MMSCVNAMVLLIKTKRQRKPTIDVISTALFTIVNAMVALIYTKSYGQNQTVSPLTSYINNSLFDVNAFSLAVHKSKTSPSLQLRSEE